MFNPRNRLRTIVVSLELKQIYLSLMILGCLILALHATADGAVATLPDKAMFLLHVAGLGIGITTQITICKG